MTNAKHFTMIYLSFSTGRSLTEGMSLFPQLDWHSHCLLLFLSCSRLNNTPTSEFACYWFKIYKFLTKHRNKHHQQHSLSRRAKGNLQNFLPEFYINLRFTTAADFHIFHASVRENSFYKVSAFLWQVSCYLYHPPTYSTSTRGARKR